MNGSDVTNTQYRQAMGSLLALYTQVDGLIGEVCDDRLGRVPDAAARAALAKQVVDERRHVEIQEEWISRLGTDPTPPIPAPAAEAIRAYFAELPWLEFLADLYLGVEALGSGAVEEIVPLADPGTRESLRVPLADEADHVAFGVGRLREELSRLEPAARRAFVRTLPARLDRLAGQIRALAPALPALFAAVGVPYAAVRDAVVARRTTLLDTLAAA